MVPKTTPNFVTTNPFSILDEDVTNRDDDMFSDGLSPQLQGHGSKESRTVYNAVHDLDTRTKRLTKERDRLPSIDKDDPVPLRHVSIGLVRSARKIRQQLKLEAPLGSMMKLCSLCESIFAEEHTEEFFESDKTHPHHGCQASLNKSVALGCGVCLILHAELHRQGPQIEETTGLESEPFTGLSYSINEDGTGLKLRYRLEFLNGFATEIDLGFVRAESLHPHLTTTPISTSTRHMNWDLVRYWLHKCRSTHAACGRISLGPRNLPTRLLEVSMTKTGLKVRLKCDIKDNDLTYTTLSHCWGTEKIFTLTVRNLKRLCNDVPIDELPQIFRDAMWVTSKLGLRYIWIDSLCIMQGQEGQNDWLRELPRMSAIYRNGYCNIAGTGFADGRNGLFVSRNATEVLPGLVETNWIGSWEYPKSLRKDQYFIADDSRFVSEIQDAPLSHRAWVVQERFLSPCTLHFGQREVFWECSETICSEVFPAGLPEPHEGFGFDSLMAIKFPWLHDTNDPLIKQLANASIEQSWKFSDWQHTPDSLYSLWHSLVVAYSVGKLTRPADKLPAISGIVTEFQPLLEDQYIAGLWRKNIIRDLSWNVQYGPVSYLPLVYRAPTWSWASIDAEISCYRCLNRREYEIVLAEVLDIQVTTLDETGIGPLTSGYLTISGQLLDFKLDLDRSSLRQQYRVRGILFDQYNLHLSLDMAQRYPVTKSSIIKAIDDGTVSTQMDEQTALSLYQGPIHLLPLRIDIDYIDEVHVICLILGFCGHIKGQHIRIGMCTAELTHFRPLLGMSNVELAEELYEKRIDSAEGTKFQVTIV